MAVLLVMVVLVVGGLGSLAEGLLEDLEGVSEERFTVVVVVVAVVVVVRVAEEEDCQRDLRSDEEGGGRLLLLLEDDLVLSPAMTVSLC